VGSLKLLKCVALSEEIQAIKAEGDIPKPVSADLPPTLPAVFGETDHVVRLKDDPQQLPTPGAKLPPRVQERGPGVESWRKRKE